MTASLTDHAPLFPGNPTDTSSPLYCLYFLHLPRGMYIHIQRGPLKIDLMVGEYHVLRSIVEYSLPRLIGWSAKMEASLEQSIDKAVSQQQPGNSYNESPHNYQGNNQGGGVPF